MLQDYAYMCEEAYLSGSHELNLEPLVIDEPVSSNLRLRSVGLMKIDKIQNSPSQRILRVLLILEAIRPLLISKLCQSKQSQQKIHHLPTFQESMGPNP